MVDHETICNCRFRDQCETFNDALIDDARKGPEGFGCREQHDLYRGRHCRTFACGYLSLVLTDAVRNPAPE